MKLDGELAFCDPNIGLEPESQSFEFNDSNPDSIVCKSISEKVKENDKRNSFDSKSNEDNSIPTQYGMEEFDSEDTEVSDAKRSHDAWIHDSPEEFDSCENSEDTYSDECVTESQPELIVCYKESNCHLIKDICVDEGVPAMDKVRYENSVDAKNVSKFLPYDNSKTEVSEKDNREISVRLVDILDLAIIKESSDKVPAKHHQSEDLIQKDENASEDFADQNKGMVLPGGTISLQEREPEAWPSCSKVDEVELNHAEVCSEPELHSKHEESKNKVEEAVSANPLANEQNSDILVKDSNFVPADSVACCSKEECHQEGSCKFNDFQNTAEPEDGRSVTSQVSHCNGESSFSAVGVSSHICYSGAVPFSGNISLRSDSSTTSMRSFAFPILQHEWDSSPVRMAKVDKRHQQRHKSWRECLLCCRF
ncbi:hypothetical protein QN277_004016 [Acacia crassicarpa]|uniref:18S pre-ribosomal assembly protein gar2-related n=1 Tax=Acacia crassicarpa TaxID=499986 RepID=A0AAE1JX43_9FABA|nr:hypothetical protein QN277_004016 [Acacia crassicarpa]